MEDLTDLSVAVESEANARIVPKGWKKAPDLKDLKQDLEDARPAHDIQKAKIQRWLDHLHVEGEGKPKIKERGTRSTIQPKLIRKQAEWRYAALSEPFLAADDLFDIDPVTWEDVHAAEQNKLVINNQFNTKIDKQAFIDEYVRTAVDEGTVVLRLGWRTEEEERTRVRKKVEFRPNPELLPMYLQLSEMQAENPTRYNFDVPEPLRLAHEEFLQNGMPLEPIVVGEETVTETVVVRNHPTIDVCDYRHVILDPSCNGKAEEAGFVVYSFPTSLSALQKTGLYKNLDQINLENASILADPDHDTDDEEKDNFNFRDKARRKFVAYEYWGNHDIYGDGVLHPIVATWVGNTLIRMELNPYPDKSHPFVFVPLMPKKKSAYGEPDGELLIDNQKIIGAVTRGMIDIMARSANGQMGTRKDALDATNRRKFQMGLDYEYNGNVDPRLGFFMHTYPEIPSSAQWLLQQQNFEAESMTGVKAFSQGINSEALGDVVAGIKGAMDSAGKRETGILRRLAAGLIKAGRKIIAMNAEFLEDEEIIRITNDNHVVVRRDDLAGNFDLRMDISTTEEDNIKAQELAFMLQTIGNNLDVGITKLILRDISRLRKMPELAHEIENYQPQPDPLEQQIRQLELEKLQAEIDELRARTFENQTDGQLNQAKIRETHAKADQADLDFVEQESGVKQEREKELHGEQARANVALETHKAALASSEKAKERHLDALDDFLKGAGKQLKSPKSPQAVDAA